ncbi:hypothetical protein ACA30_15835 [Virgibacillus soli]|uniref:Uncharacterized protein n=1 Tax=Lederbergia galactosidilytica TaxID=217031 RepID=A0A0Q9XSS2_9BACI|nr:hypothetical protein ACA29_17155 [Lederbergia galactosidilytica]KRG13367.1 hypothetical protein ACA30_15835 [Virgibacillus soli]
MIGIDWLFIGGATSVVGVALIEKLAEEYGFGWLGCILRLIVHVASIGAGFYLFDIIAEVFL